MTAPPDPDGAGATGPDASGDATAGPATLTARGVAHGFGGEPVLSDVSLSVSPGEVVTVVGPSGVGKTTLLGLLALFRPPDAGTVAWDGEDAWSRDEAGRLAVRRRIGMVFQEAALFDATVAANVAYGLRVRRPWAERARDALRRLAGVGDGRPPAAVEDALETVGMADSRDRNALSLSGGEAQRVAFARALAVSPEVLLLDEPTSNLDPRNTAVVEDAIGTARERGLGVVVATHDMHQAERVSDRVAVLLDGTVTEVGPPEQVFGEPADPRTRKFVTGELVY